MKAIVSLFISAYQPGMASIECRANSLTQSRQPLFFSDSDGSETSGYKESQMEGCYLNEDECGDVPSYEDICWMISRAPRSQPATGLLRDVFTLCKPPLWLCKNSSHQLATTHRIAP